jgi:hypothetical protein
MVADVATEEYADWGSFEISGAVSGQDLVVPAVVTVLHAADPIVSLTTMADGADEPAQPAQPAQRRSP